jgi:hypothetical protein
MAQPAGAPVYYQFDFWRSAPLQHGVFTRLGGVSRGLWASLNVGGTVGDDLKAVAENHARMYAALDLTGKQICTVWQVHGADTVIANAPMPQRKWLARADGMVTNRIGLPLTMRFADCAPLLFYDPVRHAIGLAHAGWRGTVQSIALSTLEAMCTAYGSRPEDVQAAIGPSIGPERYEVGEEVVEAVRARFGSTEGLIRRSANGSVYFNLWEANRRLLAEAGVQQIEIAGICTASNTDEFFSHRAEKGRTGRFGVVIALVEH